MFSQPDSSFQLPAKTCFEDSEILEAESKSQAAQETLRALTSRIKRSKRESQALSVKKDLKADRAA